MKKFLTKFLVVLTLLLTVNTYSQIKEGAFATPGPHTATIYFSDGSSSVVKFNVNDYGAIDMYLSPAVGRTLVNKYITTYTWINSGGIWTESQTWIFSKDKVSNKTTATFLRVVQNEGEDPWTVSASGRVYLD
jgi:hypothetical protein